MKQYRIRSAEPEAENTLKRLRAGRNRVRMIGLAAAILGALLIPAWVAGIGMGYFQLDQKMGPTVFPKLMSEEEAESAEQRAAEIKADKAAEAAATPAAPEAKAP